MGYVSVLTPGDYRWDENYLNEGYQKLLVGAENGQSKFIAFVDEFCDFPNLKINSAIEAFAQIYNSRHLVSLAPESKQST